MRTGPRQVTVRDALKRRPAVIASQQVLTRRLALMGCLLLMPMLGRAADWPERPVRMIVPFGAGAGADTVGRIFAEELAKALGQPVIVDKKGGAGGLDR